MTTNFRTLGLALALGLSSSLFVACDNKGNTANEATEEVAENANEATKEANEAATDDNGVNDNMLNEFVMEAGNRAMFEVELSKVALAMAGVSAATKDFATKVIADHTTEAGTMTTALAAKNPALKMPTTPSENQMEDVNKLKGEKDMKAFEKRFAELMVKTHRDEVEDFDKMSREGKDADLKMMATNMLPSLRNHLVMAEQLEMAAKKM